MADVAVLLAQGDRSYVDEDYEEALKHYTLAIQKNPTDHKIYESRAKAYIQLEKYEDAVQDANQSVQLNPTFAKGYLQKGIASFHLEEYEAAKESFEEGAKHDAGLVAFKKWIRKCQAELDDESTSAQPAAAPAAPKPAAPTASVAAALPAPTVSAAAPATATSAPAAASSAPAAASTPVEPEQEEPSKALAPAAPEEFAGKYRHQFYQLQDKAIVDVYAKNLKPKQVNVTFEATHLHVAINNASGEEEYSLDLELYSQIEPELCKTNVLRTKVEVVMKKAQSTNWGSLHKSSTVAAPNYSSPDMPRPSYPTSYKKKPKDWSAVEAEIAEQEKTGDLDFGDPLSNFFKKIFAQGDEDQRRAMMKSFQESNGTVLSTNWDEVGKKKVECTPPDGMEVHKWES